MMADPWVIFAAQIPTSTKTMSPTSKYFTITNLVYWRYKITITGTPYRNYNNKHINLCLSKGSWNKSPLKLERGTKRWWRPTRRRLPRKKKKKRTNKTIGASRPRSAPHLLACSSFSPFLPVNRNILFHPISRNAWDLLYTVRSTGFVLHFLSY